MLLAVIVYVAPVCPCVKLPVCVLVMIQTGNFGNGLMVVTSSALNPTCKPPPLTVTVLVTLLGAFSATFTVPVMGGWLAPGLSGSPRGQVLVTHAQFIPAIDTRIRPDGRVS